MFKLPELKRKFDAEQRNVDQAAIDPNGTLSMTNNNPHTSFRGDKHVSNAAAQEHPEQLDRPHSGNVATIIQAEADGTTQSNAHLQEKSESSLWRNVGFLTTLVLMCAWGLTSFVFVCVDLFK